MSQLRTKTAMIGVITLATIIACDSILLVDFLRLAVLAVLIAAEQGPGLQCDETKLNRYLNQLASYRDEQ